MEKLGEGITAFLMWLIANTQLVLEILASAATGAKIVGVIRDEWGGVKAIQVQV